MNNNLRNLLAIGFIALVAMALLCWWWEGRFSPTVPILLLMAFACLMGVRMGPDSSQLQQVDDPPLPRPLRWFITPLLQFTKPDLVPDYLAQGGFRYCGERMGLCFVLYPVVEGRRCYLTLAYQNRYESPCRAEFLIKPDANTAKQGLKRLRFEVVCEAAGFGETRIPWSVPAALQGQTVSVQIGAEVNYPEDRGRMVRFRAGIPVGNIQDVEEGSFSAVPTTMGLNLPTDVDPDILAEAARQSLSLHPTRDVPAGMPTASPVGMADDPARQAEAQTEAPDGGQNLESAKDADGESAVAPGLSEASLERLLSSCAADPGLKRHRAYVRQRKSAELWKLLGLAVLGIVAGAAFLALGLWIFREGRSLKGLLLIIFGGGIGLICLVWLVAGLPMMLIKGPTLEVGGSVLDACTGFYKWALMFKPSRHIMDSSVSQFLQVCEYFPLPVVVAYAESDEAALALTKHWRAVREQFVADDLMMEITEVKTKLIARENGRVVDVVVRLRGKSFGEITFRNVAINVHGRWLLATPEPILFEPGTNPSDAH